MLVTGGKLLTPIPHKELEPRALMKHYNTRPLTHPTTLTPLSQRSWAKLKLKLALVQIKKLWSLLWRPHVAAELPTTASELV